MVNTLRHRDALALAASWSHALSGCGAVSLSIQRSEDATGTDIAWLEIDVQPDACADAVVALRDAVAVLHSLSRCAGYAAHLNAAFWREFMRAAEVVGSVQDVACAPLDEAFPRFRLRFTSPSNESAAALTRRIASVLDRFSALEDEPRNEVYEEAMKTLEACVVTRGGSVEMALELPSMDTEYLLAMIQQFTQRVGCVEEIALNQHRHRPQDPLSALRWLDHLPRVKRFREWTLDEHLDDAQVFGRLYRHLLGLDAQPVVSVDTLIVDRSSLSDGQFAALCSALPHSRSVRRLRLTKDRDWEWNLLSSAHDWAWLAYAVFHPVTNESNWKALRLDGCGFRVEDVEVMRRVRRNGVYETLSSISTETPHMATKSVVEVRSGARVFTTANPEVATPFDLDTLGDSSGRTLVALDEPSGDLQPILVPGLGISWIDMNAVKLARRVPQNNIVSQTPWLLGLEVNLDAWDYGTITGLKMFVELCGVHLRVLDIIEHEPLRAGDVQELLAFCPELQQAAFNHDGSVFSNPPPRLPPYTPLSITHTSKLRSIRLSCSLIEAYFVVHAVTYEAKEQYSGIESLHFQVTKATGVFHSVSKALGVFILANPSLSKLVMVKKRKGSTANPSRMTFERHAKILNSMGISLQDLSVPPQTTELPSTSCCILRGAGLPSEVVQHVVAQAGEGTFDRTIWMDLI